MLAAISAVAAAQSYRVAGIVQPENGTASALIEMPDGRSVILRVGDRVGEQTLVEISYPVVVLQSGAGQRQVLKLAGSAAAAARNGVAVASDAGAAGNESAAAPPSSGEHAAATSEPVTRTLDASAMRGLTELQNRAATQDSSQLAAAINAQLGLEAGEVILQVNDRAVASPADALETIRASLEDAVPLVMNLASPGGPRRVYLLTDQPAPVSAD